MKSMFCKQRVGRFIVVLICVLLVAGVVLIAQEQSPTVGESEDVQIDSNEPGLPQTSFGPLLLKTVVSLFVVVGMTVFGMYGLKHFVNRKKNGNLAIRVIGSTMLGPKKGIYLVEVSERWLLLGVTDASISMLTELEKGSQTDASYPPGGGQSQVLGNRFREFLDTFTKKRGDDG
jgi:flagellar biosynthetic protein FliO